MSFWDCKPYIFTAIFSFLSFPIFAANSDNIRQFFKEILLEKTQGYYIKSFSSIENIAMKNVFDEKTGSWQPAILCVDFAETDFHEKNEFWNEEIAKNDEDFFDENHYFRDNFENLRLFELGNCESDVDCNSFEQFSVDFENKMFQNMNKNVIFRTEYDDFMRISRKICWNVSDSQKNLSVFSIKRFEYADGSSLSPSFSVEDFVSEHRVKKTMFGENALPSKISETKDGVKTFDCFFYYDSNNRMTSEIVRKYSSEDTLVKRTDYIYTQRSSEPDYRIFEDGELRFSKEFADEGSWTETTRFDGGYEVSASYEHGIKRIETVYQNNRVIRRRRF